MRQPFSRLVLAQAINRFGDGFFSIGVSWLIYARTHSVVPLGLLWAGFFLMMGGFTSVIGPVVDRIERRRLVVALNLVRAAIVLTPLLLARAGVFHVAELAVAFLLVGLVGIPHAPALTAMVPSLVDARQLKAANARLQGTAEAMYLVGPAAAGLILAAYGPLSGLAVDSGTFLAAALLLATLPRVDRQVHQAGEPYGAALRIGARTLWHHTRLRLLAILSILIQFTDAAFIVLSVPLVRSVLHGTTRGVGFLEASLSGGFIVGAWLATRLARRQRQASRWSLVLVFCLATAAIGAIPLLAWALLTQVVAGVAGAIFQVEWDTAFQSGVDDQVLGRVLMWQRAAGRWASALGAVAVAALAWEVGVRLAFVILGAAGTVLAGWTLARLRQPRAVVAGTKKEGPSW